MSANKAALLNSATERAILEHDKALKGLKVKQIISTDALKMTAYGTPPNFDFLSVTLDPGEVSYRGFGILGADSNFGIPLILFNFYIDVDNDPDYIWFNGSQVSVTGRRKLLYGWKYDTNDFNGVFSGKAGKIPINYWIKNEDIVAHTYYVKVAFLASFIVEDFFA